MAASHLTPAADNAGATRYTSARFQPAFATTDAEVRACQRLRYGIFADELGAEIDGGQDNLDIDDFDAHCHHLYVRDADSGDIVACTRLLTDEASQRAGRFYSAGEFDMDAVAALPARKVEVGRTCVHAEFRTGVVISALWQGLAGFVANHGYRYLFGCASIGLDDGGETAKIVLDKIRRRHMAPADVRVRPYRPYPVEPLDAERAARMPALLKAYVSLGASACGEPFWDTNFNCCDVFMLLDLEQITPRYARRFKLEGLNLDTP